LVLLDKIKLYVRPYKAYTAHNMFLVSITPYFTIDSVAVDIGRMGALATVRN